METIPENILEKINSPCLFPTYNFFPITGLQVGKWLSAFHIEDQLFLYSPEPEKIVMLAVHSEDKATVTSQYFLTYTRKELLKMCTNSPFTAPVSKTNTKVLSGSLLKRLSAEFGGIVAFEIELKNIDGLDYSNTLNSYGSRLTLEVKKAKKLWFSCPNEFCKYYNILQEDIHTKYYTPVLSDNSSRFITKQILPSCYKFKKSSEYCDDYYNNNSNTNYGSTTPDMRIIRNKYRRSLSEIPDSPLNMKKLVFEKPFHECEYNNFTIVAYFEDPIFPFYIKNLLKKPKNKYLLTMYERGIPSWAQFLPSYGLPYRPWMRRVMAVIIFMFSLITMLLGFYDLYKNIPQLRDFLSSHLGKCFETFEQAIVLRFSMLLGYIIASSQVFRNFISSFVIFQPYVLALIQQIAYEFEGFFSIFSDIYSMFAYIFSAFASIFDLLKKLKVLFIDNLVDLFYFLGQTLHLRQILISLSQLSLSFIWKICYLAFTLISEIKDLMLLSFRMPFDIVYGITYGLFDVLFEFFSDFFAFFTSLLKAFRYITAVFKSNQSGLTVSEGMGFFKTIKDLWYDIVRHCLRGITSIYHFVVYTSCNVYKHKDSMLVSLEIYYRYLCYLARAKINSLIIGLALYLLILITLKKILWNLNEYYCIFNCDVLY